MKNLKANIIIRGLVGALGGIFVGHLVSIVISLCIGGGEFRPVPDLLTEQAGSEIMAVIWQSLACMLYGSVWAIASIVWELEGWSLMKQTVVHGLSCSLSALPIAWLLHWFPHTWAGFLGYVGIFAGAYVSIWLSQLIAMKRRVKAMNEKLNAR